MSTQALILMMILTFYAVSSNSEDLLNDQMRFSLFNLHLRPYAVLPDSTPNIISMTNRPGDDRLYVTTQEGMIYVMTEMANGRTEAMPWFDAARAIRKATKQKVYRAIPKKAAPMEGTNWPLQSDTW